MTFVVKGICHKEGRSTEQQEWGLGFWGGGVAQVLFLDWRAALDWLSSQTWVTT